MPSQGLKLVPSLAAASGGRRGSDGSIACLVAVVVPAVVVIVPADPVTDQGARARTDYGARGVACDGVSSDTAENCAGHGAGFTGRGTAAERGSCQRNGANTGFRDKATHLEDLLSLDLRSSDRSCGGHTPHPKE